LFVFSGVKQSYFGGNRQFNPCFLLDVETWHTSTGTHLSSQCWTHFDKFPNFFSLLCTLVFSHNSFLKELLSSHKKEALCAWPNSAPAPTKPTIHWMSVITQFWMNLNWVNIWLHLGDQFCKKSISYIGK
jgi:hypothetical protein